MPPITPTKGPPPVRSNKRKRRVISYEELSSLVKLEPDDYKAAWHDLQALLGGDSASVPVPACTGMYRHVPACIYIQHILYAIGLHS